LLARQALPQALGRGACSASELAQQLNISPRSALRLLAEQADRVLAAGNGPQRRYAWRRSLRGAVAPLPLFAVGEDGSISEGPAVTPVSPCGVHCLLDQLGWPVDGSVAGGFWPGLPYPLYDMAPQGFLGRSLARVCHTELEVPADTREWGDDDILHVLARRGADTSGHLIVGEGSLRAHQQQRLDSQQPLSARATAMAYAGLAQQAAALGLVGSSAAGEFPKFTARRQLAGMATPHVIVKFSGVADAPATQRWADLLVCEHLALSLLPRLPGVRAARTRVLQSAGRTFLEAERFDRLGEFGRKPLVSLHAVNGHLLGLATQDWRAHARQLHAHGWLGEADVNAVQHLWWFGHLIANSDMHLGNLSLHPTQGRFTLAPLYDMLPMAYAPLPGGEVPAHTPRFQMPLPAERGVWIEACALALRFWDAAAADARISAAFRATASAAGALLLAVRGHVAS
jgi:hypothetical protein